MAENIYDYQSKFEGEEIDDILDSVKDKVDKVEGKGLSTEDFTTLLKEKLESLNNYDDTQIAEAVEKLRDDFDALVTADASGTIDKFNEIVDFLAGIEDSQSLDNIIASIEQQIASKADSSDIVQADMADLISSSKAYVKNNPFWELYRKFSLAAGRTVTIRPIQIGAPTYFYADGYDDANGSGVVCVKYTPDGTSSVDIFDGGKNIVATIRYREAARIDVTANIDCVISALLPKQLPSDVVNQQQADWLNYNPYSPKWIQNKQFGYIPLISIKGTGSYRLYFPGNADKNNIFVFVYQKDGTYYNDDIIYMGEETVLEFDGLAGGLIFNLSEDGTLVVTIGEGYDGWLNGVDVFVVVNTLLSGDYLSPEIARVGYDGTEDTNTLKGATAQLKKDIIQEYLHIKPTVKISHSRITEYSQVFGDHPYLHLGLGGELVVMHYSKSTNRKFKLRDSGYEKGRYYNTRWRECLGAPYKLPDHVTGDWVNARCTEPAVLPHGRWSSYRNFVRDICERATRVQVYQLIQDYELGYLSMAQEMARRDDNAIFSILGESFYDYLEDNDGLIRRFPYKPFIGNKVKLDIGVALRIPNPEYQELLDSGKIQDTPNARRFWWYDEEKGYRVPKYLYSDVCEMTISMGPFRPMFSSKFVELMPRLAVK